MAGAICQLSRVSRGVWKPSSERDEGKDQPNGWKSSNRRSISRRRLSNGAHSPVRAGADALSSLTGSLVAGSAMAVLLG